MSLLQPLVGICRLEIGFSQANFVTPCSLANCCNGYVLLDKPLAYSREAESDLKELDSIEAQVLSKLLGLNSSAGAEQDSEGLDTMPDIANLLKGLTQSEGLATDMETKLDAILAKLDGLINSLGPEGEGEVGKGSQGRELEEGTSNPDESQAKS